MVLSTKEYKLAVKFDKDSDNIDDSFIRRRVNYSKQEKRMTRAVTAAHI